MSRDDVTRRLCEAIDAFAADRAPELVEEARAEAVAKVRRLLTETMTESLLAQSQQAMRPSGGTRAQPSRKPRPTRKPRSESRRPERVAEPVREAAPPAAAAELAHYVYGVASTRIEIPDELAGIDPRYEVSRVEEESLAAIVSPVSLSEFGEEPLHDNLNDVGWLEEKARAHEHVLDAVLQRGTVVPLRLCTIYSGEEQVREMLAEERAVMLDALERLDGKAEWGVKAIAEPEALERAAAQNLSDGAEAEVSGGTAYMQRKGQQARAKAEVEELADEWAASIHDPLADAVSEALLSPLQRSEVSGHEGDMLLNGVYLIEDEAIPAFRELVDRIAEEYRARGVSVELTGPWPPYNFVKSSIESAR